MTNLLAIETSGAWCSASLQLDGNRFGVSRHVERRHNELLLPMLTELTKAAAVAVAELRERLDMVAFGCGPGSFTGVRIAAAAAQALALASEARIIRVSSTRALAQKALLEHPEVTDIATFVRSRRDLYYVAHYQGGGCDCVRELTPNRLLEVMPQKGWLSERPWREATANAVSVGEQPDWWTGKSVIPAVAGAEEVLVLALDMLSRGEDVDVAEGLPDYLEGDSPWSKSR